MAAPGYNKLTLSSEPTWPERMFSLGRSTSMELQNDPRFFTSNVIDKRLSALNTLTIVSGLMSGTALGYTFSLKKDYNFHGDWECCIVSGVQVFSFLLVMRVVFVCFMSTYTFCQQLYHIYRLMTSGPTGLESAGKYYLDPIVVTWRHTAVHRLLKSLYFFVFALGLILSVKIMQDGGTIARCYEKTDSGPKQPSLQEIAVFVTMVMNHVSTTVPVTTTPSPNDDEYYAQMWQRAFAVTVGLLFTLCAYVLYHIHKTHDEVFKRVYAEVADMLPSTRVWSHSSFREAIEVEENPHHNGCWA